MRGGYCLSGEAVAELTVDNPTVSLDPGYYLVIDESSSEGSGHGDAVSDFIVEIVGNATFSPKATAVPTFDKIIEGEIFCEHEWTETIVAEPTCIDDGEKKLTCDICGEIKTESISATGHDYEDGTCKDCGEEKPHIVRIEDIVQNADGVAIERGAVLTTEKYTDFTVNDEPVSGNMYTFNDEGEYKITATDENGTTIIINITIIINNNVCTEHIDADIDCACDVCGEEMHIYEDRNYVPTSSAGSITSSSVTDHGATFNFTNSAEKTIGTLTVQGKTTLVGYRATYTYNISAPKEGDCTVSTNKDGTMSVFYSIDGKSVSNGKEIHLTQGDHTVEIAIVGSILGSTDKWQATIELNAMIVKICKNCGNNHEHSYNEAITASPTCTAKGEKTLTCDCGKVKTESIPATGHDYVETITKNATCTENGEKLKECMTCGYSTTSTIYAAGHKNVNGICSVCGESTIEYVTLRSAVAETSSSNGFLGSDSAGMTHNVKRHEIVDVHFHDYTAAEGHYFSDNNTWDPTGGTRKVIAWYEKPNYSAAQYSIHIAPMSETVRIRAPKNASYYFAFLNGTNSEKYPLINGYENIDFSQTTDMSYMFYSSTAANIHVDMDTSNVTNIDRMFSLGNEYSWEKFLTFSERVDFTNVTSSEYAFQGHGYLVNFEFPRGLTILGTGAFNGFGRVSYATLNVPSSVTSIGSGAFKNVRSVSYSGPATGSPWGAESVVANDVAKILYNDNVKDFVSVSFPTSMAAEEDGDDIGEIIGTEVITPAYDEDTTVKYGIGDSVPFKLTAVLPDSISVYDTYKLVFHDEMSVGLTYDEGSLKVFAGDTEISAENYTVAFNGQAFTVTINDIIAEPYNAVAGTEISVRYTATLNDSAAFKNLNDAYLEYSNNPNGSGLGRTVSDEVTAFTFTVKVDKIDGKTGNELNGAGFTLYKKNGDDGSYSVIRDEVKGGTAFSFSGLGAGDYKLVESTTPNGYNTMEDLEFTIVADSREDADGIAYLTVLKIVAQGSDLNGEMLEGWSAYIDTGILNSNIANYKGSELPSTGGIGTIMFYAVGGMIVLAVGFVLVKKRKEQAA